VEALRIDWSDPAAPVPLRGAAEAAVPVVAAGTVHAVVAWYALEMGGGTPADCEISTAPGAPATQGRHWRQAVWFVPSAARRAVAPGETVAVEAAFVRDRLVFRLPEA
jgi:hypothetical protein